jgi:Xaa-Pro aminopeptidase
MESFLAERRRRLARALDLPDALVVIGAGEPIPLPEGTDQTYPFRSHAEYFYAAAQECAGGIIAFDPRDGEDAGWVSFVPEVTEGERVWEGRRQVPGTLLSGWPAWLAQRAGRTVAQLGEPVPGVSPSPALTAVVRERFTHARRPKDGHELAELRRGAAATAAGYRRLRDCLRAGRTERELQIELEAEFFRAGATGTGYGTIVGTGPNSAVLHFAPSGRPAAAGEFILVDAGSELNRYVTDVTRTYVLGAATALQRDLYQLVLAAEERAVSQCRAGVEWRDLHLATAVQLVAGLVAMGLMRGDPESLVEQEAHTLFFPHGLGHMVGLGVRDASGLLPGRRKDPRPSLSTLRMDLPLAPGYLVTVEPGLYFIPALLQDPSRRTRFRDAVNWELVDQHMHLGGVRIEDNVLVTGGAPEVLTADIPKSWADAVVA